MKLARTAAYSVVLLFAASISCTNHAPPAPHVSGPDSGFVGIPVEFTASYPDGAGVSIIFWYWDSTGNTTHAMDTIQHTYADTGLHVVWATGFWGITDWLDHTDYYESERSNLCTLRILSGRGR
jgi:hypothetical protein